MFPMGNLRKIRKHWWEYIEPTTQDLLTYITLIYYTMIILTLQLYVTIFSRNLQEFLILLILLILFLKVI